MRARELSDLIANTLDLSRLEAGRAPLALGSVSIPDLLRQVDEETRRERVDAGLTLEIQTAGAPLLIVSDATKLKVVMKNLIGNALKFTPAGGIRVAARPKRAGVELVVSDTGVGIEPDFLPRIFEAFEQGDPWVGQRRGGVGLGLFIVRRLLELVGGTIQVESRVGSGSTFSVWIPDLDQPSD
jgi:signal transduction histidine kinase